LLSRRLIATALAAAVVLALASEEAHAQGPASCAPAVRKVRFFAFETVDGVQRTALVHVPAHAAGPPLPLLLAFHGAGADGRFMESYTGLSKLADRDDFVAVYPTAEGSLWNSSGRGNAPDDDVAFVRSLIDDLESRLCVDPARVYATGVSNGGSFTARIGCELSDQLTAIAPVAGGYGVQPPCTPTRPVSVLEIHGTDDGSVPYDGDPYSGHSSVPAWIATWEGFDECAGPATWRRIAPKTLVRVRLGCAPSTTVAQVKLVGGHHVWPGTPLGARPASKAGAFSASAAVWQFFTAQTVSRAAYVRPRDR
jgi:polyhydroxybutyrate depolymerase